MRWTLGCSNFGFSPFVILLWGHNYSQVVRNLRKFPPSSFHPGNEFLQIQNVDELSSGAFTYLSGRGGHHGSKASIRVAIIVATVGPAVMIAFVSLAYYRAQHNAFHGRSKFSCETSGKDVKLGRFALPSLFNFHEGDGPPQTSLSFSNDHLLVSTSRSLLGQAELATETVENVSKGIESVASSVKPNLLDNPPMTSMRKSYTGSPLSSSPHFSELSEHAVPLEVYSPDQLAGQLYFFNGSAMFTAEELSQAPADVLGRSSHGTSYKATLESGQMLTVKWLMVGLMKNKKEFAREVKKVGLMRHPNIVPVQAYYWGPDEQDSLFCQTTSRGTAWPFIFMSRHPDDTLHRCSAND